MTPTEQNRQIRVLFGLFLILQIPRSIPRGPVVILFLGGRQLGRQLCLSDI